jgi:hypothetical protein
VTADYDARIRAVQDATRLLFAMQDRPDSTSRTVPYLPSGPRYAPLDRFEVVELARFLLGIDDDDTTRQPPCGERAEDGSTFYCSTGCLDAGLHAVPYGGVS